MLLASPFHKGNFIIGNLSQKSINRARTVSVNVVHEQMELRSIVRFGNRTYIYIVHPK
jgi:hypothetical protein